MTRVNPHMRPGADHSECSLPHFTKLRWLFRHLLQFLRDGSLPDDRPLLAQLYREAAFFHLNEMQKAIEEEKVGVFGVGVLFFISLHSYW